MASPPAPPLRTRSCNVAPTTVRTRQNLPYAADPLPGVYQPTPIMNTTPQQYIVPANEGWGLMLPFVLQSQSQFRVGPGQLFDLQGAAYTPTTTR